MPLVELDPSQHADLKVDRSHAIEVAKEQHLIGLKVTEIAQAISCFPVFFSRASESSDWTISAVTSILMQRNLFVVDDQWDAIFQPSGLKTYPFYLMDSPRKEKAYTIGIDPNNAAFCAHGEALFDEQGKASDMLMGITQQLDADMKSEVLSYKFCQRIEQLELFKAIDVLVHHVDDSVTALTGLHTIDEEKLQSLAAADLAALASDGLLAPMYAMLMSMFQLNQLIRRHNLLDQVKLIKQVTMEPSAA